MQKTHWRSSTSGRKNWNLITAGHKVLSEGGESRTNHRYAVVVQDLVAQWIQSCQCKTETSSGDGKEFIESFSKRRKAESHLHRRFIRICTSVFFPHPFALPSLACKGYGLHFHDLLTWCHWFLGARRRTPPSLPSSLSWGRKSLQTMRDCFQSLVVFLRPLLVVFSARYRENKSITNSDEHGRYCVSADA